MSKIKVSEIFYSLQGEGRWTGAPSIFFRTFGCNFNCRNFGRYEDDAVKPTESNPEVTKIANNIDQYKTYEDLPLVHTGCDSYASWDPRFKHLSPFKTIDEIASRFEELIGPVWGERHLVITGGEPLLGWQKAFVALLQHPFMSTLKFLTFETNGTYVLHKDLANYLQARRVMDGLDITFSASVKLPSSGHGMEEACKPAAIQSYIDNSTLTYFKFVASTQQDVADVDIMLAKYKEHGINIPVYLMAVGGTSDTFKLNNNNVAQMCMDRGWMYSDRLQVSLWSNAWGT